jgi:endonuclease/exonuclease/phosphatase family metal-dependent hydrolase
MTGVRVMTYNIYLGGRLGEPLDQVVRRAAPDVLLVNESPKTPLLWRRRCHRLAGAWGMRVVTGGRPAGSNLILSSLSVEVVSSADVLFSRDPRLHRRGTAIAVLSKHGSRFAVAGIHLDLVAAPRLRHVAELEAALARHVPDGVPAIVGGDVNDTPGSRVWDTLSARRRDAFAVAGSGTGFTFSAREPRQRIDGVFVDPRLGVTAARVPDDPDVARASDHRPLLVDLELPG